MGRIYHKSTHASRGKKKYAVKWVTKHDQALEIIHFCSINRVQNHRYAMLLMSEVMSTFWLSSEIRQRKDLLEEDKLYLPYIKCKKIKDISHLFRNQLKYYSRSTTFEALPLQSYNTVRPRGKVQFVQYPQSGRYLYNPEELPEAPIKQDYFSPLTRGNENVQHQQSALKIHEYSPGYDCSSSFHLQHSQFQVSHDEVLARGRVPLYSLLLLLLV